MKQGSLSLMVGILFGAGLTISGMTKPQKVIDFLDFFGSWDPSLAFVMIGAIAVNIVGYRLIMRKPSPIFASEFKVPHKSSLDKKLIMGSILFGIGWGLAGYCPGPALTSLVSLNENTLVFVAAMVAGMFAFEFYQKKVLKP